MTAPAALLRRKRLEPPRRPGRPAAAAGLGAVHRLGLRDARGAIILLFGAVPIVWSAVMSFQRNNLLSANTPFVGLHNYRLWRTTRWWPRR